MVDFQTLYRKCSRANLLGKPCHELQDFLDKSGSILAINEHTVSSFKDIEGYAVQTDACRAFFPKQTVAELKASSHLDYIREQCLKVDFVTPPFMQNQFLGEFAKAIETGSDLEKIAEEFAPRMYGLEGISALSVDIYRKNSGFTKYSSQIDESIEAFYLGLNRVAITSLMPCIEGIIRDIGIKIGIPCEEHVNVKDFVKILEKIQQRIDIESRHLEQSINIDNWPTRFRAFKNEKAYIVSSSNTDEEKQNQLSDLLRQHFTNDEIERIEYLELDKLHSTVPS